MAVTGNLKKKIHKTLRPRRKHTKHVQKVEHGPNPIYILSYKRPPLETATSFGYRDATRRPHIMFYTRNNISHGIKSSVNNRRKVVAILYERFSVGRVMGRRGHNYLFRRFATRKFKNSSTDDAVGLPPPPFRPAVSPRRPRYLLHNYYGARRTAKLI